LPLEPVDNFYIESRQNFSFHFSLDKIIHIT